MRLCSRQVADALELRALSHPETRRRGNTIELEFTFIPDISAPMANYTAWLRHARECMNLASRRNELEGLDELDLRDGLDAPTPVVKPGFISALLKLLAI